MCRMCKIVIGLSGKKRAGKDFACAAMRSKGWEDGIDVHRLAFADALKQELADACGVDVQFIEENKDAFRLGLQWWGTQWRRGLCRQEYWLDKASEALAKTGSPVVVVPDVRFPNEAQWIKSNGGVLVRINRTSGLRPAEDAHESETALDNYESFDFVFENDMTDNFFDTIEGFWESVILQRLRNEPAVAV